MGVASPYSLDTWIYLIHVIALNEEGRFKSQKAMPACMRASSQYHDLSTAIRCGIIICLFELMLNVPINSYGHVGTLSPFRGTCVQS